MDYQLVKSLKMKWQIIGLPNYKWSECKRLINTMTGREIKKTINGGSVGYWVAGKFISINKLRGSVEIIKNENIPF